MKLSKKITQLSTLFLAVTMLISVPSMQAKPSLGQYSTKSIALHANKQREGNQKTATDFTYYAAAAALVASSYISGVVVGKLAHYAYDYLSGHQHELAFQDMNYTSNDFSQFDN